MIPDIKELYFPKKNGKQYATLTHAEVSLVDMGEKTITTQILVDADITPDFSQDWAIEYKGDKYIMPLREPQASKSRERLDTEISLTFQHWAIYQLKRWPFVTIQPIEAGTAIPDEEVADVILNLVDFCDLFGQVLEYYYGGKIAIDLNPGWESKKEPTPVSINHSYIWDVLLKLYELYAVRWTIEPASDNNNTGKDGERYVIKVGYPTADIDHIFTHSFEGGLWKIERQVQSDEIRNIIKGRGGDKNIPFRYFKNTDSGNPDFEADPDWIKELETIPFANLRGATFRSYIQGWKAAHISKYPGYTAVGEANAYSPWAYRKGYTDTKFHPVEFVADEITLNTENGDRVVDILPGFSPRIKSGSSIDRYGPLQTTLDNNDEIYPSLQGSGKDVAVFVEQITSDEDETTPSDAVTTAVKCGESGRVSIPASGRVEVTLVSNQFFVPEGKFGNIDEGVKTISAGKTETALTVTNIGGKWSLIKQTFTISVEEYLIEVEDAIMEVVNTGTNEVRSASGIPGGTYFFRLKARLHNTSDETLVARMTCNSATLTYSSIDQTRANTFDVWIPNVWDSAKLGNETEEAYSRRIWQPRLGNKDGQEAAVMFTTGELAISEDYEFKIPSGIWPVHDESKIFVDEDGKEYQSHWRLMLVKSDAELESSGMYIPSTKRQGKAGDRFVFIGTEMTHEYTLWAEIRLDDWKKDELLKLKDGNLTFAVTPDRVRLNGYGAADALITKLKPGCSIVISDGQLIGGSEQEFLYLQSLKITYREPTSDDAALNPDIEMTLGKEYEVSANPVSVMQSDISALQRQIGSLSNIQQAVATYGDKKYISKVRSDRTPYALSVGGRLTAETEIGSPSFAEGLTGFGWQVDQFGNVWADSLTLRRFLEVPELRYNRTEVIVGNQWQAPGAGIVESYVHKGTSKADDNGDGKESDCNIGVLTLKLEDGELGSLSEGDLCMGIWHFGTGTDGRTSDEKADSDDGKGTFKFAGFTTVYFIVYKVEGDRRETLRVRTREEWPAEPAAGMHFVAFGNRKWNYDKNAWEYPERQKSAYRTRTYERFLVNVNNWTFGEDNIAMQFGDLANLTIAKTNMAGYSAYLNNIYMAGVIRQLDAKLRLEIRTSGDHYVADGDTCLAMIYAFHGANDVSTEGEEKLKLTAKRKGDNATVTVTRSENGNFMTLDKSLLGTSDSATVTVSATYTDYKGKTFTASADIVIYDRALLKGDKGDKGIPGTPGKDGKTSYFHVKYAPVANPTAAQMSETPDVYIGTYVDYAEADSNDPTKYTWARFQGAQGKDGTNGIPGTDGQDGQTSYLHIKYSDDGGLTFTPAQGPLAVGETPGKYIGQYVDFVEKDSTKVSDYKWSKFEGDNGENGSSYTENLLTGTRGFTAPWTIGSGSAANGSYEGLTIVECNLTGTGAAAYADLAFRDYAFTDGETYTLSFWARTGVTGTRSYVHVPVPGVVIASDGIPNTAVTTTTWHMFELGATAPWRRYRITFKAAHNVPFAAAHNVLFRLYGGNGSNEGNEGNAVQLAGVKLERGENAHTEWSPATEEMLGKDAVNIIVSPSSLVVNNNQRHTIRTTKVYVDLYDGDRQVNYGGDGDGFLCSTLTESISTPIDPEGNVEWRFNTDNSTGVNRFFYYFNIAEGTVIDRTIPFTVTYKGRTYQSQLGLKTVSDGADGKDAVTYDWLVSPDIIHCDYDGSVLTQSINVKCFRIEGTTRTEVNTGIRYKIADRAFAALPANGNIALTKSILAGVTKPKMTLQLVSSDSTQTVLSEHVTGYICDGETGQDGPQGSVVRIRGLFKPGKYYDGTTPENPSDPASVRWLDVVWVVNASGDREYKRCLKSGHHTAVTAADWGAFSQLDNLIVELLIAKNAHIKFLNGQEIVFGNVENGVEKTWGRIGYPTQNGNLIMYAGGATSGLATFTLDKTGKARFGAMSGERIEIEPTDMEMRVFDAGNRQVVTIDGDDHNIAGMYGSEYTKKELGAQSVGAPVGETVTKRFDLDEFTVGDGGATFSASVKANLSTQSVIAPGPGGTTGVESYVATSACSAILELYRNPGAGETRVDFGSGSLPAQSPTMDGSNDKTECHSKAVTLSFGPRNLTKGKYQLRLTATVENGKNGTAEANASVGLSGYARSFKAGNSPKALLCANGLIVANSTQDYLVAGLSGGTFNVEAHAGERGIRLDKSGVIMQDDNGAWTQGIVEHCTQRALNIGACVGKTQGVRHWMIDDNTTGQPEGASQWGALTVYNIDNGGVNVIQEYRSFDSPMQLWTRKRPRSTTDSRWTEWYRQF